MTAPGTPGSVAPPGEDYIVRRIADLERQVRELGPSIAQSFASTVAALVGTGACGLTGTGFAVTTTQAQCASGSIIIPDGYTQAIVQNVVMVSALNDQAVGDYLYAASSINGITGAQCISPLVDAGTPAGVTASAIRTLTGLAGGSIPVGASVMSGSGAWSSSGFSSATINAIAIFLR